MLKLSKIYAWRISHPEQVKKYQKTYYEKNKDKINEKRREKYKSRVHAKSSVDSPS
jgi:hypothetical protein